MNPVDAQARADLRRRAKKAKAALKAEVQRKDAELLAQMLRQKPKNLPG